MDFDGAFLVPEPDAGTRGENVQALRTDRKTLADIEFALSWQSAGARHTDCCLVQNLNLWRDWIPPEIEPLLLDRQRGDSGRMAVPQDVLVPKATKNDVIEIPVRRFNTHLFQQRVIEPQAGRFYPRGCIAGVQDIYGEDMTPFRVGDRQADKLTVDISHPLAGAELSLSAHILGVRNVTSERGGRAQDLPQLVAGNGPGMQARWQGKPTDFFSGAALARVDTREDTDFYARPRFVDHLDATALKQVRNLYARLLPAGGNVLDLMASVNSHLPAGFSGVVSGLGLNEDELAANGMLSSRLVHDLNRQPELPYADAAFDAVVCTVSVEYLIRPFEVFRSVARVLKPGGKFIVSFSNRWFPPKTIAVWMDLHPFERMGLVLEYFLESGRFTALNTFSLTGLPRPAEDKYAGQMQWSDPVYAVWGEVR